MYFIYVLYIGKMKPMKEVKTSTCIVSSDKFGIIHKTVRTNAHLDAADIKKSDDIGFELSQGKKALILYDARPKFTLTEKGMEYLHKHLLSKDRIASAIVSDQAGVKMLVDYFKDKQKTNGPQIRIFKTMHEALVWLLSFKDKKAAAQLQKVKPVIEAKASKVLRKKSIGKSNTEPVKGSLITCIAKVEVDKKNIAYKRIIKDTHVDLDSLKQSFKETLGFLGNEKRLMLYDLRAHFTITDDALNYVIDKVMGETGIATAVVAKTIGVYLMADYAVNVKKIKSPLKVFTDETKALKWLAAQKKKAFVIE